MLRALRIALMVLATATGVAGCARLSEQTSIEQTLLRPTTPNEDSVTLEILFVRFPFGESSINQAAWQGIDEQQLPNELRRRLAANGFRAGIISGQVPNEIAELLNMTDTPTEPVNEMVGEQLVDEPKLRRRVLQLRSGRRGEIISSDAYQELPVLTCREGDVCGQTYRDARAMFALFATPTVNGNVEIELIPEIKHGQAKQKWNGQNGILRLELDQPKARFDRLGIAAALAPGHMLVLSSLPDRPGSIGHSFFADQSASGAKEQKLLIVRLARMPAPEWYAADVSKTEAPCSVENLGGTP